MCCVCIYLQVGRSCQHPIPMIFLHIGFGKHKYEHILMHILFICSGIIIIPSIIPTQNLFSTVETLHYLVFYTNFPQIGQMLNYTYVPAYSPFFARIFEVVFKVVELGLNLHDILV